MRRLFIAPILVSLLFSCNREDKEEGNSQANVDLAVDSLQFDSVLAKKYGADDYGMKQYVMAFLRKGPNRDLDSAAQMELQMKHLKNINRLADEGKLILAGPFMDDGYLRGIYIFNVSTIEEAEKLTNSDPAIQAGSLIIELKPWYGSAAVIGINEAHQRLAKKSITDQ